MEIELIPLNIMSSDDEISRKVIDYIIKSEEILSLNRVYYTYTLSDEDDDMVYIASGYNKPYRKKGIDACKNAMKCVRCDGDNFQKVYGDIAFLARLLIMINSEQRGKNKKIPKAVKQAIKLYKEISPENYKIYIAYFGSRSVKNLVNRILFAIICVVMIILATIYIIGVYMVVN